MLGPSTECKPECGPQICRCRRLKGWTNADYGDKVRPVSGTPGQTDGLSTPAYEVASQLMPAESAAASESQVMLEASGLARSRCSGGIMMTHRHHMDPLSTCPCHRPCHPCRPCHRRGEGPPSWEPPPPSPQTSSKGWPHWLRPTMLSAQPAHVGLIIKVAMDSKLELEKAAWHPVICTCSAASCCMKIDHGR